MSTEIAQLRVATLQYISNILTGPHIGLKNAWPMSLLVQAQTSDDDEEIMECVNMVLSASLKGLVHESVDVNYVASFTRSWFAWANGVFAVTILDLAQRKPHLIFGAGAEPYYIGGGGGKV